MPSPTSPLALSDRIAQARERAESYAARHPPPKQTHQENMKAIERERQKWSQLYQEKSVIIEQLERELGSTVDALHKKDASFSFRSNNSNNNTTSNLNESIGMNNTSIDVINLSDALRKENQSVKVTCSRLIDEKQKLEDENIQLRIENNRLVSELSACRRQYEQAKQRWDQIDVENSALIQSLRGQQMEAVVHTEIPSTVNMVMRKEKETMTDSHNSDIYYNTRAMNYQEEDKVRSNVNEKEKEDHRVLLFAREEISWLRDIIANRLSVKLPPFHPTSHSIDEEASNIQHHMSSQEFLKSLTSQQTLQKHQLNPNQRLNHSNLNQYFDDDDDIIEEGILNQSICKEDDEIENEVPNDRQLHYVSLQQEDTMHQYHGGQIDRGYKDEEVKVRSIVDEESGYEDIKHTIARAHETKRHLESLVHNNVQSTLSSTIPIHSNVPSKSRQLRYKAGSLSWLDDNSSYQPSDEGAQYKESLSSILAATTTTIFPDQTRISPKELIVPTSEVSGCTEEKEVKKAPKQSKKVSTAQGRCISDSIRTPFTGSILNRGKTVSATNQTPIKINNSQKNKIKEKPNKSAALAKESSSLKTKKTSEVMKRDSVILPSASARASRPTTTTTLMRSKVSRLYY